MKLSDIKKGLNSGTIVQIDASQHALVAYNHKDILYDDNCLYTFEKFISRLETESKIVHLICDKFGVERVFAYMDHYCDGTFVPEQFTLLAEKADGNKLFDCECSYLVSIKKEDAHSIPENEGSLIAEY